MPVGIVGLGAEVPDRIVTNEEISAWTGAPTDWIVARTGVHERRYAGGGTTSDLATGAAREALGSCPGARERLAALIVATCTPDSPQPATAAVLQDKLGLAGMPAFDLNAVCSGFLFGLSVAEAMLAGRLSGGVALVVGVDMFSTIMDRSDRRTVSLFGDGAGAVLLAEVPDGYGILALRLVTDGSRNDLVHVRAGGTRQPLDERARTAGEHLFRMDGRAVREYALTTMRTLIEQVTDEAGVPLDQVDRFVFHQANPRLLEAFAEANGLDPDRVELTGPTLGNTAAASIPLTLHQSDTRRPIGRGELVLMASVGGGMTAGAALVRWYR